MLKQRQQIFKKCSPVDVIDIEEYTPKMTGKWQTKRGSRTICLSFKGGEISSPSAWLTDTIIDAARKLLKQKVPLQTEFHCKMGSEMFAAAEHVHSTLNRLNLPKFCTTGMVTG